LLRLAGSLFRAIYTSLATKQKGSRELQRRLPDGFYNEIREILKEFGRNALRQDKIISHETMEMRRELLLLSFRELYGMGFKLKSPRNLQRRHVEALAKSWEERELSASTIANRLSVLSGFSAWIGKPTLVSDRTELVKRPETIKRKQATTEDKSWSAAGIDIEAVLGMVEQYDARVALQMRLMKAFALRRKEAVMFRPHRADLGGAISVRDGTKGGRERVIMIETAEQRDMLDLAKSKVKSINQHIGHPDLDLEQAINRFNYVLVKFGITKRGLGITSHGLRHGTLNDVYEETTGSPSPVRSKSLTADLDKLNYDIGRARVSQMAGHARLGISNAYIGARPSLKQSQAEKDAHDRFKQLTAQETLSEADAAELGRLLHKLAPGVRQQMSALHKTVSGKKERPESETELDRPGQLDL
jgi:integrase